MGQRTLPSFPCYCPAVAFILGLPALSGESRCVDAMHACHLTLACALAPFVCVNCLCSLPRSSRRQLLPAKNLSKESRHLLRTPKSKPSPRQGIALCGILRDRDTETAQKRLRHQYNAKRLKKEETAHNDKEQDDKGILRYKKVMGRNASQKRLKTSG